MSRKVWDICFGFAMGTMVGGLIVGSALALIGNWLAFLFFANILGGGLMSSWLLTVKPADFGVHGEEGK